MALLQDDKNELLPLYDAFLGRRLGADWPKELARMQAWLQRDEKGRLAAAG